MSMNETEVRTKQPGMIGRYQYLGELGMGSMADVIKAYDPRIDRILVIKLIRHQYSDDEAYKKLFLQEARSAGNLSHPNIVTIYDVGEFQGKPYLAMELLSGLTLDQQMQSAPFKTIEEIIDVAIQITKGIGYAHQQGIVHRDIKAANIIYNPETSLVKILDFGIAHVDKNTPDAQKSQNISGTPEYMAPEQILGVSTEHRTDLYSLGVLFYFLLCGYLPFEADTNDALFQKITHEKPLPIKPLVQGTPPLFMQLISKLLSKNSDHRVQTCEELLEILEEVQQQLTQNKEYKTEHRFMPLRFKWTLIMAAVVAFVMSIGLLTVNHMQYKAMTNIVFDYGGSLMKMVGVESAENLLIEDFLGVQTLVEELQRQQTFRYLTIVDRHHVIRGSSDPLLLNQVYSQQINESLLYQDEFIKVSESSTPEEQLVFKFSSPIYYQNKIVGQAYLGLAQDALSKASSVTTFMMISLMVVTILTVVLGIYLLTYRLTQPLQMLSRVLDKAFSGNFSTRIPIKGNDELSLVYRSYNRLVEHLEKKKQSASEKN